MGAEINSYQLGDIYKAETAQIDWSFQNNATINSISSLGEMYKYQVTTWPRAMLQSSKDNATWAVEWTQAGPGTASVWTSWTHASETLPTGTRFLRFRFFGAVRPLVDAVARFEVNLGSSGSMGVTLASASVPQVTLGSRLDNSEVNFTLTNSTTGESVSYSYPMKLSTALELDTVNRTVSYRNKYLAPPELSSVRQEWLRLSPGANVITYSDDYTGAVDVVLTYQERKNV
jgi:hypothetical protein